MKIISAILFSFIFLLAGCIEDPVKTENNVNGKVTDFYGFPCSGYIVEANVFTGTFTDDNGLYSLPGLMPPYTLILANGSRGSYLFSEIRKIHADITLLNNWNGNHYGYVFYVHHPVLGTNKKSIIIFISGELNRNIYSRGDEGDSVSICAIDVQTGKNSISGRVIYLEMTVDNYHNLSCEKFGIKDTIINLTKETEFTFTENEITYNPAEYIMDIKISVPEGLYTNYRNLYLNFGNNKDADVYLDNAYTNCMIPVIENLDYKIKIEDRAIGEEGILSQKWVYVNPGENAEINHNKPPEPELPINEAVNVTDSTTFKIRDDSEPGIYEIIFWNSSEPQICFFTNRKEFRLEELQAGFWFLRRNTLYYWKVIKLAGYNSIDEFISQPFINDNRCNSLMYSNIFHFTTSR